MKKRRSKPAPPVRRVAEPVQVYLAEPDLARLERLATQLDVPKSDVLRRGLAALEIQTASERAARAPRLPLPRYEGPVGLMPGVDLSDRERVLELLDGPDAPR